MTVEQLIFELRKLDPDLQVCYPHPQGHGRDRTERPKVVEQVIQTRERALFSGKLTRCVMLNPTMEAIDRMVKR